MTAEEKQAIVKEVIEVVLNKMPEVIGNLMMHHSMINEFKTNLKTKYPEFSGHEKTVAKVLESIEGQDLTLTIDELMQQAVPKIKNQIEITDRVDTTSIREPSALPLNLADDANGML